MTSRSPPRPPLAARVFDPAQVRAVCVGTGGYVYLGREIAESEVVAPDRSGLAQIPCDHVLSWRRRRSRARADPVATDQTVFQRALLRRVAENGTIAVFMRQRPSLGVRFIIDDP